MPFPTIRSATNVASDATTTIPYPATVNAGDILLFFGGTNSDTVESGWTLLADGDVGKASTGPNVQYKVAVGTEGGTTFTTATSYWGRFMVAIDSNGALPEAAAIDLLNTGSVVDPPALTPSGGAKDYMWIIWGFGLNSSFAGPHTQPSGFTALASIQGVAASYQNLNVATLNPGAWGDTDPTNDTCWAATAAIAFKSIISPNLFFGSHF